jgi:MFS family permease
MSAFKNRVLPVIAGLATGWLVIFVLEAVNHQIYPPPTELDFTDKAALTQFMETLPTMAFVLLLISWMIGAFVAGMVGAKVKQQNSRNTTIIIGVILAMGSIINMIMIPHPVWLMILASVGYVPFAYFGGKLVSEKSWIE